MTRDTKKRHEKKPVNFSGLSVVEGMEKFMPNQRTVITRAGGGLSDTEPAVVHNTTQVRDRKSVV